MKLEANKPEMNSSSPNSGMLPLGIAMKSSCMPAKPMHVTISVLGLPIRIASRASVRAPKMPAMMYSRAAGSPARW